MWSFVIINRKEALECIILYISVQVARSRLAVRERERDKSFYFFTKCYKFEWITA